MTSCAYRIPSAKVACELINVAAASVGLIRPLLISEKCVCRFRKARRASPLRLRMRPTVAIA